MQKLLIMQSCTTPSKRKLYLRPVFSSKCRHTCISTCCLSLMSFPCVFKKYECSEMLLFGKIADHESECVHKPFACPTNTSATCSWEGSASQLLLHFTDNHQNFVKDKAEFKLELDKDVQGILMVTQNSITFIVKYFYIANEKVLKHDVRFCCKKKEYTAFFEMKLINGTDADCNTNLKLNECFSYDESFFGMQNAKVLNISTFLESLGDPDCIVVALKLKVDKYNSKHVTTANDSEVNFDLIKALRCYQCQNLLVPPLFDLDGKTICGDCGKNNSNCKSSNDTDLLKRVTDAVYPCLWRTCFFKGKSNIFQDHVLDCQFRQYCCVYDNCKTTFKLSEAAVTHLQTHKTNHAVYISDKITYKTSFTQSYLRKDIITIKNNITILILHKMINLSSSCTHHVNIYTKHHVHSAMIGIVEFEHEHCILRSKEFHVGFKNFLQVTLKELPPCFEEKDELTVTVKLYT